MLSSSKAVRASLVANLLVSGVLVGLDPQLRHWFMVPTTMCGIICLAFVLTLALRRSELFTDPVFLVSALGYFDTYLAPILHVHWGYKIIALPIQPDDYRPWLGRLACIYLIGIGIIAFVFLAVLRRWGRRANTTEWVIDRKRLLSFGFSAILLSIGAQTYAYWRMGGVSEYMSKVVSLAGRESWTNMGWLLVIAESLPLMVVLLIAGLQRQWSKRTSVLLLSLGWITFLVMQTFFGGLRGSRSNLVVNCFFAIGIAYQVFGPISTRFLLCLCVYLGAYSYVYGYLKDFSISDIRGVIAKQQHSDSLVSPSTPMPIPVAPPQAISPLSRSDTPRQAPSSAAQSTVNPAIIPNGAPLSLSRLAKVTQGVNTLEKASAELTQRSGRTLHVLLLADFSRSDVLSFVLQQFASGRSFDFAYGRSYLGTLNLLVPRAVSPHRLPTKVKWTAEMEKSDRSFRIYGPLGEAMLNFGYAGIPIAFSFMGLMLGTVAALSRRLRPTDARRLLIPGLIITSVCGMIQDSDNILYFAVQFLFIPTAVIFLSSRRYKVADGLELPNVSMQPGERFGEGHATSLAPSPEPGDFVECLELAQSDSTRGKL